MSQQIKSQPQLLSIAYLYLIVKNTFLLASSDSSWSDGLNSAFNNALAAILCQCIYIRLSHVGMWRTSENKVARDLEDRIWLVELGTRRCHDVSSDSRSSFLLDVSLKGLKFGQVESLGLIDEARHIGEGDGDGAKFDQLLRQRESILLTQKQNINTQIIVVSKLGMNITWSAPVMRHLFPSRLSPLSARMSLAKYATPYP